MCETRNSWEETPKQIIHVKGWCGLGLLWSSSDFDDLDALGYDFLDHMLVPQPMDIISNKKLYVNIYIENNNIKYTTGYKMDKNIFMEDLSFH